MTGFSRICALAALLSTAAISSPAQACSETTACEIEGGAYFIALPDATETPPPAVMFLHGYGGSGQGVFRNRALVDRLLDRGYAVISPAGSERPGRGILSWAFHPFFPSTRDEGAFIAAVRDTAVARHGIDPDRILLTGFSVGGSMVSYLACASPDAFAAYAPVGGNFWRPHPTKCAGPVRMLHTHGWTDGTVPLEGRVLRGADSRDPDALIQGDIFHALNIWRQTNACHFLKADSFETSGPFWHRTWERCAPGSALELALFPGGHRIPDGWADMALDWFEAL
ncbi:MULTISPECIES: PHB depolymerase family esterase [unclassified Roseovarius]|uniref:alpha/beta hydrolase family esterase n=1 Tax=unclassified Roseovarius TaxID=2614913 RepID=UPI00273CF568|nr:MULTISPECIES: alpha/beta fold hydrolase [unclassified Roseovarius]